MSDPSIDTSAHSIETAPIPDEFEQKLARWGPKIRRYGARFYSPDEGKWRKIGTTRIVQGENPHEHGDIWAFVLKTVLKHHESPEGQAIEGPKRYEALIYIAVGSGDNAQLKPKRHAIRLQFDDDGEVFVDDDDDAIDPDGRNALLREQVATYERWAARQEEHALKVQQSTTDLHLKMMDKLTTIADKIGGIVGSSAEAQNASAKMMMGAAKFYAAGHQKNSETRRYEVIQDQMRLEAEEGEQRRQMGMMAAVAGAPVLLRQMGWQPKEIAGIMQAAGPFVAMIAGGKPPLPGQGPAALPGAASSPQAAPTVKQAEPVTDSGPWDPPPKPDIERDDDGRRADLAIWIFALKADQEREIRKIVGPTHYDRIRAAADQSDEAAMGALSAFWKAVTAESMATLTRKAQELNALLGESAGAQFVTLCQLSASGV